VHALVDRSPSRGRGGSIGRAVSIARRVRDGRRLFSRRRRGRSANRPRALRLAGEVRQQLGGDPADTISRSNGNPFAAAASLTTTSRSSRRRPLRSCLGFALNETSGSGGGPPPPPPPPPQFFAGAQFVGASAGAPLRSRPTLARKLSATSPPPPAASRARSDSVKSTSTPVHELLSNLEELEELPSGSRIHSEAPGLTPFRRAGQPCRRPPRPLARSRRVRESPRPGRRSGSRGRRRPASVRRRGCGRGGSRVHAQAGAPPGISAIGSFPPSHRSRCSGSAPRTRWVPAMVISTSAA